MQLKKDIAISESGFLFDPSTGESFNLNKSGALIVKLISEGKTESEIISNIMTSYKAEEQILHRYLDEFVIMLHQFNLLEEEDQ